MKRQHIALVIALVAGLVAVLMLNQYIKTIKDNVRAETLSTIGQTVNVVAAATEIKAGQRVEDFMLGFLEVPSRFVQPNYVKSPRSVIGKIAAVNLAKGEQISATQVTTKPLSRPGGLAVRIPKGKRAITIPIDKISAVGGMISPSDYVDILGTFPQTVIDAEGKEVVQPVMVTFMQNVLVLAVGTRIDPGDGGKADTVTLALAPIEAQVVAYVQQNGQIRLVLRPPLESGVDPVAPIDANAVYQYLAAQMGLAPEQPDAPKVPMVEIYRGKNRKEEIPLEEK